MNKLLIIVPQNSLVNSYLMHQFYVYEKIADAEDVVYYKQIKQIGMSPMETINHLVSMFMLSDFSVNCNYGDYTFRVRS